MENVRKALFFRRGEIRRFFLYVSLFSLLLFSLFGVQMTLSSKYRDAMQQLALLTKEVAYYQRRAEALTVAKATTGLAGSANAVGGAVSGSQGVVASTTTATKATTSSTVVVAPAPTPPTLAATASNSNAALNPRKQASVLAEVVAEMNRMDRILADHARRSSGDTNTAPGIATARSNGNGVSGNGGIPTKPLSATSVVVASTKGLTPAPPVRTESPPAATSSALPMATDAAASSPTSSSTSSESLFLSDCPSPPLPLSRQQGTLGSATVAAVAEKSPSSDLALSDEFEVDLEELDGYGSDPLTPEGNDHDDMIDTDKETKEEDWDPKGTATTTSPQKLLRSGVAFQTTPTKLVGSAPASSHRSPTREANAPFFPHSASPKFRFNEEYPGDIVAASSSSSVRAAAAAAAKKTPRTSLADVPDDFKERDDEDNEEEDEGNDAPASPTLASLLPSNGSSHTTLSQQGTRERMSSSTSSSIDAFEASFFTSFPVSFTSKDDPAPTAAARAVQREEIYNPFAQSPVPKDDWRGPLHSSSLLDQRPAAATPDATPGPSPSPSDPPGRSSPVATKQIPPRRKSPVAAEAPKGNHLAPLYLGGLNKVAPVTEDQLVSSAMKVATSTSSRSPLSSSGAFLFQTPPPPPAPVLSGESSKEASPTAAPFRFSTPPAPSHGYPSPTLSGSSAGGSANGSIGTAQPKRPEKTGHDLARARREKVLQPRSAGSHHPSPATPPSQPLLTPVSGVSSGGTATPTSSSSKPTFTGSASSSNTRRVKGLLDPNSREAIILSARERLSASLAMSSTSSPASSLIPSYATPPSSQRAFSENHLNLHHHSNGKHEAAVLWGESVYDDDGDIPLRSSLTKNMDVRIRVESSSTKLGGRPSQSASPHLPPQRALWQDDVDKKEDFNDDGSETGPSNSPRLSKGRAHPRRMSPPSAAGIASSLAFQHPSAPARPPEALLR